uniref:RING-type E3 ubiquitin transferase n=1 Tax=Timema cristinae TaxID=61476 RepID=A0A7R9CG38_TIMCR|nr:unnamed protein product [Timema cristinae]
MSGEMSQSTESCILVGLEEGDDAPLSEILLNALECPVCMEYMVPPIVLCESGHNICDQCRPKLPICPACRMPFLEARNIALETLAQGLRYPCRNRHLGCPEVYPMALISKHHLMCQHRPYECPLKVPGRCSWKEYNWGAHCESRIGWMKPLSALRVRHQQPLRACIQCQ